MHLIGVKGLRALLLVVFVGLVCSCGLVYSQGTNGSLTGQITDPTGAAIVGATVTLTNVGTNFVQTGNNGLHWRLPVQAGPARQLTR